MSLTVKFALFTSILCLAIVGSISYLSYRISHSELELFIGQRLGAIARSGAVQIDGTLHDQIQSEEDVASPVFETVRDQLRQLKQANDLKEEIYTFRRKGEKLMFVVMTHDKPFFGDEYSIREEMLPTLNMGQPAHTGVYRDVHGEWISAYAPIKDRDGHISGLLEVDMRVEEFTAILNAKYFRLLGYYSLFALIAVVLSFLLAKTVTRKLNYLTEITEKISLGKTDTPIQIKGKDEVAKLGASLERMRESLKIAAKMIQ